jgi:hypothetical protein
VIPIASFHRAFFATSLMALAAGVVVLTALRVPIEFRPVRSARLRQVQR